MAHVIPEGDHLMVAAINFGTSCSGYAFSFRYEFNRDPLKIFSNWMEDSPGLISIKTPSTVLLNSRKDFEAFGYEAENRYTKLIKQERKGFYFFRRFKMVLFEQRLTRDTTIKDITGKTMEAIHVFSHAIRYLKKHMMDTLETRGNVVLEGEIHWVLTVPAICDNPAKQFLREAAEKAGITGGQLTICFCVLYIPSHKNDDRH